MSEVAEQLSARQEAFCTAYIRLGSAAAAARRAGYSPGAAKSQGWRLLQEPRVRARLDELRRGAGGPGAGGADLAGLMAKLEAVYDDARHTRDYSAAVRAVEAQARLIERFGAVTVPDADTDGGATGSADTAAYLAPELPDAPETDAPAAEAPEADADAADDEASESAIGDPPTGAGPIRDPGARFAPLDAPQATPRAARPGTRVAAPAPGGVDAGRRWRGVGYVAACIRVDLGQRACWAKARTIAADMFEHLVEKWEKRHGLPVPSVAGC